MHRKGNSVGIEQSKRHMRGRKGLPWIEKVNSIENEGRKMHIRAGKELQCIEQATSTESKRHNWGRKEMPCI